MIPIYVESRSVLVSSIEFIKVIVIHEELFNVFKVDIFTNSIIVIFLEIELTTGTTIRRKKMFDIKKYIRNKKKYRDKRSELMHDCLFVIVLNYTDCFVKLVYLKKKI